MHQKIIWDIKRYFMISWDGKYVTGYFQMMLLVPSSKLQAPAVIIVSAAFALLSLVLCFYCVLLLCCLQYTWHLLINGTVSYWLLSFVPCCVIASVPPRVLWELPFCRRVLGVQNAKHRACNHHSAKCNTKSVTGSTKHSNLLLPAYALALSSLKLFKPHCHCSWTGPRS